MENNETHVEAVSEPKIETRFGVSNERKILSSQAVKFCAVASGIAIIVVFLLKSPDETQSEGPGVSSPDVAPVQTEQVNIDSYSATEESNRIKSQGKRPRRIAVAKLPGLQKIDRRHSGQIPPGSLIKAILITGASNGPVRIEAKEALRVQGETLIPEGATLLGTGQATEDRLFVRFTQVVFKDGSFENVSAQAADVDDKTAGLKGSRIGRTAMKYAAAIGLNFAGGMAEGLQEREAVGQQVVPKNDARNALLSGASKATFEMANETMTDLKSKAPNIQVEAGKEILVIFDGDGN